MTALFLVGCGGGGGATLYPVKGKVTMNGKAITVQASENALVEYHPDKSAGNNETVNPRGPISADGTYELSTNGKPGAPAGKWIVTVVHQAGPAANAKDADQYAVPKPLINPNFGSVTGTYLKREVKPDGGDYDLPVTK